jgi:hypothetical protein
VLTFGDEEELGTIGVGEPWHREGAGGPRCPDTVAKGLAAGVDEGPRSQLAGRSPCSDNTARCCCAAAMNVKARIFYLYSNVIGFVAGLVIYK